MGFWILLFLSVMHKWSLHVSPPCGGEGANSLKLWVMFCRATCDRWVIVKSSDKMGSTREGNGNPFQYSCCENPINSMKRQKDMTPEDEPLKSEVSNMLQKKSGGQLLIALERMKLLRQNRNDTQLCMCLVVKVKSSAVKNSIVYEPGM